MSVQASSLKFQRIVIIGNAGAGKSRLARRLASHFELPLVHVDSCQFVVGSRGCPVVRPRSETLRELKSTETQSAWLMDGYGPLEQLTSRLARAELIVMIDFPLWRHYLWCTKRQFALQICKLGGKKASRCEMPTGTDETRWIHIKKIFHSIGQVHRLMRPEMLRILAREDLREKTWIIRDLRAWRNCANAPELFFSHSH